MGCGSSGAQASQNEVVKEDIVEPFPAQWAQKKDEDKGKPGQATSSGAASKDSSPQGVGSGTSGTAGLNSGGTSAAAGANKNRNVQEQVVLQDEDVSDVEVIYEGKMSSQQNQGQNPQDANAQEAPTSGEPEVGSPKNFLADEQQKPIVLSKQQQEEAAKMAEQRKRFDNQRYQSQISVAGAGDQAYNSPQGGAAVSRLPLSPKDSIVPNIAAHDAVMGVNASTSPRKVPRGMEAECLPGGIMDDTPRAEVRTSETRNNHHIFDDDEEMLMKDIVEEVEGSGQR